MDNRRKFLKKIGTVTAAAGLLPIIRIDSFQEEKSKPNLLECDPTTLDYYGEGPFYTDGAPELGPEGVLVDAEEPGDRLVMTGSIFAQDCITKIPGALLDIWHANDAGDYDNEGYHLRGKLYSDDEGNYIYETIVPGKYLNGSSYRPSHIHIKASADGFNSLTTQMYFEGDEDIPGDAAASINSGTYDATDRIIPIVWNEATGKFEGQFDIVLFDPTSGLHEESLHIHFGMINSCNPNPVADQSEIRFSVFKPAEVNLNCYDLNGRLITKIVSQKMGAGKYDVAFNPANLNINSGEYLLSLQVNGMSVHHKKIQIA